MDVCSTSPSSIYMLSLIVIRADWVCKVKRRAKVAYFLYMASIILKIVS